MKEKNKLFPSLVAIVFFFFSPHSITLMKNKLDPEGLGIILLGPFLQEFFPDQVT
jgi:hypothetical protein